MGLSEYFKHNDCFPEERNKGPHSGDNKEKYNKAWLEEIYQLSTESENKGEKK